MLQRHNHWLLLILCFSITFTYAQPTIIMDTIGWTSYTDEEHPVPPLTFEETMKGGNKKNHTYVNWQDQLIDSLSQKYDIRIFSCVGASVYELGDLSKIIQQLFEALLPRVSYELSPEVQDSTKRQFSTTVQVLDRFYPLTTAPGEDYPPFEDMLTMVQEITKLQFPESIAYWVNNPFPELVSILFANKEKLKQAIKEGFPCSMQVWRWEENEWSRGLDTHLSVDPFPSDEEITESLLLVVHQLYQIGFTVPLINKNQLVALNLFENGIYHVIANGFIFGSSLSTRRGNDIIVDDTFWSILMAYTLVKNFGGQPTLYKGKKRKKITPKEYLKMVEEVLQGKKPPANNW